MRFPSSVRLVGTGTIHGTVTAAADAHRPVRLHRLTWAGDDVRLFELRALDGEALPLWEAGAHIELELGNGLVRPYSLLPSHRADTYRAAIKRAADSTGGTRWLFGRGQVGTLLTVSAPLNTFPLGEGPAVLVGGGIGVTPLVSMAAALDARGERSWHLHYAVARRDQAALLDELAPYGDRVRLHVDAEVGAVLDVQRIVAESPPDARLYACGPNPLLAALEQAAVAAGRDRSTIMVERFDPVTEAATGGGYTVVLARSGTRLAVPPGTTILGALRKAGLSTQTICERGACGVCEVAVLEGIPDHRDAVLSPEEQQDGTAMMICCSGSLTPELVLDL